MSQNPLILHTHYQQANDPKHPQSERQLFMSGVIRSSRKDNISRTASEDQEVSYRKFKNTAKVGIATLGVRRSLNEMTQQTKLTREIYDVNVERKNIENMIINSKVWNPVSGYGGQ